MKVRDLINEVQAIKGEELLGEAIDAKKIVMEFLLKLKDSEAGKKIKNMMSVVKKAEETILFKLPASLNDYSLYNAIQSKLGLPALDAPSGKGTGFSGLVNDIISSIDFEPTSGSKLNYNAVI